MSATVSVAIVGGGPNGIALANLLGAYGVRTVVIEREREILEYPRAVGMDDEALRLFQTVQLAEPLLQDMIPNVPLRMFRADGRCFADIRASTREFGWWRRNIFMQQLAEKTLRQGLQRYPHVELRLGQEVTGCAQDAIGVTLQVRDAQGQAYPLHCDYAVAADGGRSPMREMLGVRLLGRTHAIRWLVVDVRNAPLDAPYTALNCDPRRPNVCIYLPYGYRRWEFMVFAGEDGQAIAATESVRRLLAPYVADPEAVEIVRARIVLQMAAAVQPHAWCKAAIELGLLGIGRSGRAAGDSARERFVADGLERCVLVRHQPDGTQATYCASSGATPSRRCSMSAAERSAALPSPTNVDPCMAASTRGCRSASSFSRRRVAGVSGR